MPDGFAVDLNVLAAHERELKALIAGLPDAASAGANLWNPQAFGVVGMVFAQVLNRWTNDAAEYVGKVKAAGDSVADRFTAMRTAYDENDKSLKDAFTKLREGMDEAAP
ncbi:hypothetical protein LWC34_37850 [Kibdelosporangium philippinense]|uniref:Excreted virulence factor EspC, type VII ESX diderm n=1 Tax=Kibdelosporangium philippinense TaxID=211113 RepID=A0ABS8ZL56_9PSEU|nr:hypothetical protein [Kibdelosporangium philippinense]MCE7008536.1 hypothetical protein [Kibdelosporangium philippinense]